MSSPDSASRIQQEPQVIGADRFVPTELKADAESLRLARLHLRFASLGLQFGAVYSLFYALVGHYWGMATILICLAGFATIPWLLKTTANLKLTGHLFSAILLIGFTVLGTVEGGLKGHAIGWLASIPLMVMLLLGIGPAIAWTVGCSVVVIGFILAESSGLHFPKCFPAHWETLIDSVGYIGLVPFLAFLGTIFERTRSLAFAQLHLALTELSQANAHLQKLNQDKDEFLNIAAHDLRNPLTGIVGYAGLLKLPGPPDPTLVRDAGTTIESLGLRMNTILNNLLDVRKIEEGRLELKKEHCSSAELIAEIIHSFSQAAKAKNITIEWKADIEPPAFVGDRAAAAQIFENLLSNAIKYSKPGSIVVCSIQQGAAHVCLRVQDHGPGLSPDDQRNLFKKFTRLAPKPTAGESSNGLGLWIVQKMAHLMGGDVTCESELGRGSIFSLMLPAAKA